jgi:hypothetical protein
MSGPTYIASGRAATVSTTSAGPNSTAISLRMRPSPFWGWRRRSRAATNP